MLSGEEIDDLHEEISDLKIDLANREAYISGIEAMLGQKINTLAKALRFYADSWNYNESGVDEDVCGTAIDADQGETARQALLAVGLMEKEDGDGN